MAKRAVKTATKAKVQTNIEVNADVAASGTWNVVRAGQKTLAVNADQLEITESGALIFIVGSADNAPAMVVASNQYLFCTKVR
jgi:hypothetical protein